MHEYQLHKVLCRLKKMIYVRDLRQHLKHSEGSINILFVVDGAVFVNNFSPN